MPESLPPADWFPDPTDRHEQRWWDGASWTEHVFSGDVQSVDPLDAASGTKDAAATGPAEEAELPPGAASREATPVEGTSPEDQATDDTPAEDRATEEAIAEDAPVEDAPAAVTRSAATDTEAPPTADADPAGTRSELTNSGHDELRALAEDLAGSSGGDDASPASEGWFLLDAPVRGRSGDRSRSGPSSTAPAAPSGDAAVGDSPGVTAGQGPDAHASDDPHPDDTAPQGPARHDPARHDPGAAGAVAAPRPIPGGFVAGRPSPTDPAPPTAAPTAAATAEPEPEPDEPTATDGSVASATVPDDTGPAPGGVAPGRLVGPLVDTARDPGDGDPVALENRRLLRVRLDGGSVLARQGTLVAHRGDLDVRHEGAGGLGRVLRRAATGEGVRMMRVTGSGEVFLADGARHVFLLHLEGDAALSVSGRSVLAFSDGLAWQVERVQGATIVGGGLFATTLRGDGWVALVSEGEPVVLRTDDAPVRVDTQALVAWSTGLATSVATSVRLPALVGLGSGEAVQLQFSGEGLVVVQPSEGRTAGT